MTDWPFLFALITEVVPLVLGLVVIALLVGVLLDEVTK